MSSIEQLEKRIAGVLRKRDRKSLHDLARELGTSRQALARPVAGMVGSGAAVRHEGRPPTYSRP